MQLESAGNWSREEFGSLRVDRRLKQRVVSMATRAAGTPSGVVSRVFRDGSERQGAYDLLEGGRVSGEALCASIAAATIGRCEDEDFVYVPIDGTSIQIVDHRRTKDLGAVGTYRNGARGLKVVNALAVTKRGTTIGICSQRWWKRPVRKPSRSRSKYRPVAERESRYFVDVIDEVVQRFASVECTPWISVDRGGDAIVILDALIQHGPAVHFTVRSSWDRRLVTPEGAKRRYLRAFVRGQKVLGRYDLAVPQAYEREARTAKMVIRTARVTLDARHDWQARRANPEVTVVWATEIGAPRGVERLDWMLFTSHPVVTAADARLVIDGYAMRWRIEDFHKAWKSGVCGVEDTRLGCAEAVKTWATILTAVAARVERLKHLARTEPEAPATCELTDSEIRALVLLKRDQKSRTEDVPDGVPTIALAVRWLGDLGGYGGKADGVRGAITIARGLRDVAIAARVLESLKTKPRKR